MSLTKHQTELFDQINAASLKHDINKFMYKSEWLGYLLFGQYHWVEVNENDIKVSDDIDLYNELKILEDLKYIKVLSIKNGICEKEDIHIEYEINRDITGQSSGTKTNRV